MNRFLLAMTLIVSLLPAVSYAQSRPATQVDNDRIAAEALHQSIATDYFEKTLGEILSDWSTDTGIAFWIHESAADQSVDEDTLITLRLGDLRLATALDLMLESHYCTYVIVDGTVGIVSGDHAVENLMVEAIDCNDLLSRITPKKVFRPARGGGFGGGGGAGGVFGIPAGPIGPRQDAADPAPAQSAEVADEAQPPKPAGYYDIVSPADQLIELVTETVDPDSWESNGGTGRIHEINSVLVIAQTSRNLRSVHNLLDSLERAGIK